ncbi:MAG: spore germination protein [Oscillospiraceae bacterium]|nr:spore germination protein [Oscillospiraceae bacterium]
MIDTNITKTREMFERAFNFPLNKDIVFRDFRRGGKSGFAVYIDGMASGEKIGDYILRPLLRSSGMSSILDALTISAVSAETDFEKVVSAVLSGDTAVCEDGDANAYICETKGFDRRGVDKPIVENSIVGSQEAFNESIRTNTTLLHRIVKHPGLTTEMLTLGELNNLVCGMVYINGVADMELVEEVKRRLNGVEANFVQSGGMVEQFIEDRALSLFPTVTTTERPDNTAALLMQGRVAVIVDGNPRVIVVPVTLFTMLKTSDETALRVPVASAVRAVRMLAVFAALLLPALYLAATTYHADMLPAGLLLAIARSRLVIPYPAILELLLMEISFELVKEAGQRIPGPIGSTVGIVGGLILGEAAVSAGLVSQVCVVIVAFSGLGNFAVPQYQLSYTARLLRLGFIICAGLMGFLGVAAAFLLLAGYINSLTSFGKDYVPPILSAPPLFPKMPVWKYDNWRN